MLAALCVVSPLDLRKLPFGPDLFEEACLFEHGSERYDAEVFEWLQRPAGSVPGGALDDIEHNENLVWLYYDDDVPGEEASFGFGALGPEWFRFPEDEEDTEHLQIVYLGVDFRRRGRGYFGTILNDLIEEARDRSDAAVLSLFVHEDNHVAAALYAKPKYGFDFAPALDECDADGTMYRAMVARIRQ